MKSKHPYKNLSLTDIKGERWEDIPFLDGAYRISSYGRIKTMERWVQVTGSDRGYWLKERIRKTRVSAQLVSGAKRKIYRLDISLQLEGKLYNIGIARMACFLFVRKFDLEDRTLVVVCKDGDPFNIRPGNLQLITSSASATRTYRVGHRPRDSFKNKATPVSQYDLQGKWLRTFPSINTAANECDISSSNIATALHTLNSYGGNYLWKRGGPEKDLIRVSEHAKKKFASAQLYAASISQYDLEGKKIREYPGLREAARMLKTHPSLIRRVLLGMSLTAKGFYWVLGKGPIRIVLRHLQESKRNWEKKVCRPVTQYSLTGQRICAYPSQTEAGRQLKISIDVISSALRSKTLNAGGGYFWRYGSGPARIDVPQRLKRRYFLHRFYQQPVTQYDRQGRRVAIYNTIDAAARAVKAQRHGLMAALTGKLLTCADSYWRLGKGKARINIDAENKAGLRRLQKLSRPVIQCSPSGKKIRTFPSMAAARRATGVHESNIRRVVNGKSKTASGFLWKAK